MADRKKRSDPDFTCTCPKTECVRHGNCAECTTYHEQRNQKPRCERKSLFERIFQ